MDFVRLSHTGRRTGVFLPSLRVDDKELMQFAEQGGHLYNEAVRL